MGHSTPFERVHLRVPVLRVPDQLNPDSAESKGPSSLPASQIPPEILERLHHDPWALRKLDPKDRESPEVLRVVIASGHPQAMEAISACVPPEVLRRPEIYSWLKDYRDGALPERILYFQASAGLGADSGGGNFSLGGEVGLGGPRIAGTVFYDRFSSAFDAERGQVRHLLGLKPLFLAYPAKRISMRENQSILAFEAPLGWTWEEGDRHFLLGGGMAYTLVSGELMALPVWGLEAKMLWDPSGASDGWIASMEAQIPVWSLAQGIESLARGIRSRP